MSCLKWISHFKIHYYFMIFIDIIYLLTNLNIKIYSYKPPSWILDAKIIIWFNRWINHGKFASFSQFLHWYTQSINRFKKYKKFNMAAMTPFWISLSEIKLFVINNLINLNSLNNLKSYIDIIKISTDLW